MRGLATLLSVLLAGPAYADAVPVFTPPAKNAKAQARFRRGDKLFDAKRYDDAAVEFGAAYEIDATAKFLLFNLAVARRLAGKCEQAIAAYRDFLAAKPPEAQAKKAIAGIERCGGNVEASTDAPPSSEPPVATPPPPPPEQPTVEPAAPPARAVEPPAPQRVVVHVPWYRDTLGDVLTGTGSVVALVSVAFLLGAHASATHTYSPSSVDDYLEARKAALDRQGVAFFSGLAAGALLVGGGIRYLTRTSTRTVIVIPNERGAGVAVEGTF